GNNDSPPAQFGLAFPVAFSWYSDEPTISPDIVETTQDRILFFDVPSIPGSSSRTIRVQMTAPDAPEFAHRAFSIFTWIDEDESSTFTSTADKHRYQVRVTRGNNQLNASQIADLAAAHGI